ncbi:MAG TPA: hypothetical protein VNZ86_02360, partial [Bacteroidia bacterium]|nr:hypothetical protein [Bacteroidia bacterium]
TFYMDNSPNFVAGQNQYNRIYMDQSGGQVICNGSTVKYINFQSGATLLLFNSSIGRLICSSSLTLNQGNGGNTNIIHYAEVNGSAWIGYNNTFDTLNFPNPGGKLMLAYGTTQTINQALLINGTCNQLFNLSSSNAGTQATISMGSGSISASYLLLQDIAATGGGTFTANASIAVSNVSGWTVNSPAPQSLYWVGGSGQWSDPAHWAITSGGAGGSCVPNPFDNVYFDVNSFTASGQVVYTGTSGIYCKDMDWTGVAYNPAVSDASTLYCYGSLILNPAMSWNSQININLNATSGSLLINPGKQMLGYLNLNGTAQWTLTDSLRASDLYVNAGTFRSNNQLIRAGSFTAGSAVYLGTSSIYASSWDGSVSGLGTDSCTFYMDNSPNFVAGQNQYNRIYMDQSGGQVICNGSTVKYINFQSGATL